MQVIKDSLDRFPLARVVRHRPLQPQRHRPRARDGAPELLDAVRSGAPCLLPASVLGEDHGEAAVLPLVFLAFRRLAQQPCMERVLPAALATVALALDMQRFWLLLVRAAIGAALVAVVVQFVQGLAALTGASLVVDGGLWMPG